MDSDENKEDDDISIDFSKIKNIFKKKKKVSEEPNEEIKEKAEEHKKEETKSKEEVDEEEMDINFSKIKNIFKGKKEEEAETKGKEGEEKEDEEISIDFGKIKNFFKGLKEGAKEKKSEDEEEVSLDVRKTMDFFKKYRKFLVPALLIIIAICFSVYLRMQPAYLPVTDDWARNAVYNQIRSSVRSQVDQQYPNLPSANKDSIAESEFQKVLKAQKDAIEQQITATSNYFKSKLQRDNGETHTLDIDSYYWMRHALNVLKNGHPGDELRDGRSYDTHMYAPIGRYVPPDMFHAYFQAYLYRFVSFFNRNLDFVTFVFYVPVLLSVLAVFPAFFIGKRLAGNFGGFISAFVFAIHPSLLPRTSGGVIDTDPYVVLFPLYITWLFLEAFESESLKRRITYSALAGLLVGLFSFAWGGWFYIFDFILFASLFYMGYFIVLHRDEIKDIVGFIKKPSFYNNLTPILTFFLSSAIFTSIIRGFSNFRDAFLVGPLAFITLKQVAIDTIWPNVYTTVAEQNPASLDSVVSQIGIGSNLLFWVSLMGIILTMLKKETKKSSDLWFVLCSAAWFMIVLWTDLSHNLTVFLALISIPILVKLMLIIKDKDKNIDIKAAILLILWFISTIYASVKGVRFTLLAVPAFAIALGVSLGIGYYYLHILMTGGFKINKNVSKALAVILLCLLLFGPYKSAVATAKSEIPLINDEWYDSLQKINLAAKPDAIINSWWDYGHWFKMIADRTVTFDGTSQNSNNAHWIGSVLLTNDEDYAVGVLRMVDCGQNKAFNELNKVINDEAKSVGIIEEIVRVNKNNAKSILLKKGLNEKEADGVLNYSHCTPPEDYFITSYDMIGKSGVWAHFGAWDFDRSLIYNTMKKKEYYDDLEKSVSFLQARFNYTSEEAQKIYYEVQSIKDDSEANTWIAEWPSYVGSSGCNKEEGKIICGIGNGVNAEIDLKTLQADIQTSQGIMHPNTVVMPLEGGSYKRREFVNNTIGISALVIPKGEDSYSILLMHPKLDKSMFTILFYLNGHGLKHFDKFSDETDFTGGRIIVWKVNWEGNATNLLEYYQPKPVPEEELIDSTDNSQDINNSNNSGN